MTILLADDEHLVRFSLRSMIEELNLDLRVVAEVATGEELVAAVAKYQPDVCFVDIRMPGMNGLAAIRKARKAGSRARWIILTSHAEFEYASEALQLGASAYLLKPAGPANVAEVLVPVLKSLQKERREASVRFEHSLVAALQVPGGRVSEPPHWTRLALVALRCDVAGGLTVGDKAVWAAESLQALRDEVQAVLAGELRTAVWPGSPDRLYVAAAWEEDDPEGRAAAHRLRERLGVMVKLTAGEERRLTAIAQDQIDHWEAFHRFLVDAEGLERYRCFFGTATVHVLVPLERKVDALPPELRDLAGQIEDYLATREKGQIADLETRVSAIRSVFARADRGATHLEAAARFLSFRLGLPPPEPGRPATELMRWADALIDATRAELPEIRRAADVQARIVERVDQYLRDRLEAEVRVPDIASELGLSPNYLSAVYRKLTGTTLIERLSDLRLDRARELLARPGSQVKVVASQVGYKSTRYFAQLYFARFGHHPSGR